MKIAITGHRPNKLGNDYDLTSPLIGRIQMTLRAIISEYMPDYMISGMALGIDTLWAKLAIEYKTPLIAAIPCLEHDNKWFTKSKLIYKEILDNPLTTKILTSNTCYTPNCMQVRNIWMVDNCDLLIAVWDGTSGGTKNCIDYAKSINRQIIYINPNDYK